MKRFINVLFIFLAFFGKAKAQNVFAGSIQDASSKMPVISAAILNGKGEKIAYSKLDGTFKLKADVKDLTIKVNHPDFVSIVLSIHSNTFNIIELNSISEKIGAVDINIKKGESSEASGRFTEKVSMNLRNVISSQEIEISPDITVANVIQRVSGVSIERNDNGDGQHAIVRGMDKRYNYTLVNGIKIPSPDNKNRYVPLDIFPSDLLDRLEVSKALTPNMEGDAIGGVIDMKLKDAPNRFVLKVNAGTGYSQIFIDRPYRTFDASQVNLKSPASANPSGYQATEADFPMSNLTFTDVQAPLNQLFGMSVGNRFLDGKLGGIVALSYQNTYRGSNSMFMSTFIQPETNTPYYEILQLRKFSAQQQRSGIHTKWDYKISRQHELSFYGAYISLLDRQTRDRTDTILKIGRGQGPGTGRVELRNRSRQQFQNIYNATLQGKHLFGDLKTDWSLVYSLAQQDNPDMAQFALLTSVTKDTLGNFIDDPDVIDRDFTRRWINNSDQDLAIYLNNSYLMDFAGGDMEWSAGGLYRHKERTHHFSSYLFNNFPVGQIWTGDVKNHTWKLRNSIGTPRDPLNYDCNEDVLALYAMGKYTLRQWEILGGVRMENTAFSWVTQAPTNVAGRTGAKSYSDVLPSVHAKYKFNNGKTQLRSSYFASISRPSFYEVIPYEINEEDFRERGNPYIERTQAHNLDLRFEHFSNALNKITAGVFYKIIDNPIENALVIDGQTIFAQPNNFGTATNYGFELDMAYYLGNFGVRGFYTFTQSEITTTKLVKFRNAAGNLTERSEEQTRPLQGQSKHIFNASLLYKNAKNGTDVQLSGVYTGQRIISVSPYKDNDVWQRAFFIVDFSVEQRINTRFTAYVKVNNLLNTPLRADILLPNSFNPEQAPYLDASNSVLVREDLYGQAYFGGIKFNF